MTDTPNENTLILKEDALGRVRMPKDRREAILDEFERSGMTGQAFAARIGVKYPTFASWIQKRRRQSGYYQAKKRKPKQTPVRLFEAVVESEPGAIAGCLEVEMREGLKLRIRTSVEAALAAELIQSLSKGESC